MAFVDLAKKSALALAVAAALSSAGHRQCAILAWRWLARRRDRPGRRGRARARLVRTWGGARLGRVRPALRLPVRVLCPAGLLRTAAGVCVSDLLVSAVRRLLRLLIAAASRASPRERAATTARSASPRLRNVLQVLRRPDHRPPHMRDRAIVEAEPFLRLPEVAADNVGELVQLDMHVRVERIDVMHRDHPA